MIKIYRIVDNTNGNIYIGKTEQKYLCQRLAQHRCYKDCISREIIKNGDYKIVLIEETHDENRERYHILNTECINVTIPGRTPNEYRQDNKINKFNYDKEYREKNKDIIKEKRKNIYNYRKSFGGDERSDNNLLKIDPNLFLI